MITRIFLWLTDGSGNRRRWLFRTLFEIIARLSGHQEHWTFMNYGFADAAKPDRGIDLTPAEEAQRVCCQLYDEVAGAVVIADQDVVEVSCGRGGGAAFVARHKGPRTLTGVDIAPSAIEFCRRVHHLDSLRFVQGDAECLPLFDESCDIAINIEASFCYGKFDRFLAEYFAAHAFQSITTSVFTAYLEQHLLDAHPELAHGIDLRSWIHEPGLPADCPRPHSAAFAAAFDPRHRARDGFGPGPARRRSA